MISMIVKVSRDYYPINSFNRDYVYSEIGKRISMIVKVSRDYYPIKIVLIETMFIQK